MTSNFLSIKGKRFHYIWLRDNCTCSQCREPYSFQKIFDITQYKGIPTPLSVNINDNDQELEIIWKEETPHRSVYSIPWLLTHAYDHGSESDRSPAQQKIAKRNPEQVLWNLDTLKSHPLKQYDFQTDGEEKWIDQVYSYGFSILRNVENLAELINTIGPIRSSEIGDFYDVGTEPPEYGLSQTSHALLPHNDYEIFTHTANLLHFLLCIENEVSGGESILVDGFRVAEDFRQDHPKYFQTLVEIPAQFEKFFLESRRYNRRTQSIFELDSRGEVIGVSFNNSHAWTWDIEFDRMEFYYQAYCEWFRYMKKPHYQYKFRLTPGDCIIAQNSRIFHGREAFDPNSGTRHLKTAFTEYDYLMGRKNYMGFKHFFLQEN